jgi:hypothetical protein
VAEEADDDDLEFNDDEPNPEENPAEQRAILTSFELLKKTEANARAREEEQLALPCARCLHPTGADRRGRPPLVRVGAAAPPRGRGRTTSTFRGDPKGAVAHGGGREEAEDLGR